MSRKDLRASRINRISGSLAGCRYGNGGMKGAVVLVSAAAAVTGMGSGLPGQADGKSHEVSSQGR
jgi:hypothetical protein